MSLVGYNSNIIITIALISLLSACTIENSLKENQNKRSGESQAIVDARQFFSEHRNIYLQQNWSKSYIANLHRLLQFQLIKR